MLSRPVSSDFSIRTAWCGPRAFIDLHSPSASCRANHAARSEVFGNSPSATEYESFHGKPEEEEDEGGWIAAVVPRSAGTVAIAARSGNFPDLELIEQSHRIESKSIYTPHSRELFCKLFNSLFTSSQEKCLVLILIPQGRALVRSFLKESKARLVSGCSSDLWHV